MLLLVECVGNIIFQIDFEGLLSSRFLEGVIHLIDSLIPDCIFESQLVTSLVARRREHCLNGDVVSAVSLLPLLLVGKHAWLLLLIWLAKDKSMQLHDWERLRIEIGALTNCDYDNDQNHEPYLIEDQSVEHI